MTDTYIYILSDSKVKLWGLSGKQRLQRMLRLYKNAVIIEDISQAPDNFPVLLLRADFLFDPRLLKALLQSEHAMSLCDSERAEIVAVRSTAALAQELCKEMLGETEKLHILDLPMKKSTDLVEAYDPGLLKYDPPVVLPVVVENSRRLENELFYGSYKGVTDFITLWLWPWPARWAVQFCVNFRISPNQVTLSSLVLAILAGLAFYKGYLLSGLIMGWLMTFLDTVDGKLARVTVTSSKLGDILDHGLDLVHPPLWYLAWGLGISTGWTSTWSVMDVFWVILIAYIGGRLCEGAFELFIAPFRLFLWQPWDSYNRLITARRNPNLVILSLSLLYGSPATGLWLVLIWHVISTLILMSRLFIAQREKNKTGKLVPWLNAIDPDRDKDLMHVRLFTRISKLTGDTKR